METRSMNPEQMLNRIRGEYLEMPGLRLTCAQAERLWGWEAKTCRMLLDLLVESKFLSCSKEGMYGRLPHAVTAAPPFRRARAAANAWVTAQLEHAIASGE
jgi:hypothetical protein